MQRAPIAQRRPGREPRRHDFTLASASGGTAPAQRRPGREPRRHANVSRRTNGAVSSLAQRRPGREPRRHLQTRPPHRCPRGPAQRRPGREPRRHPHGPHAEPPSRYQALNEGRGVNPGDTLTIHRAIYRPVIAQRRPGREPRRHLLSMTFWCANTSFRAQRRPGREPRRHPLPVVSRPAHGRPLNEGRGVNPGDTPRGPLTGEHCAVAQRRPGREPRRHPSGLRTRTGGNGARSTKAGA